MNSFALLALAYIAGATPTSLWLGKALYGVDLRTKGSGNLGGTNAFRVLGWRTALPVIIVDVAKGWFPVWYFPQIQLDSAPSTWALAYGGAAVLGHVFSFWVGFKGGKGIATSAGALLGLAPIAVAICIGVWIAAVALTRIVSVASLSAAITLPVAVYFVPGREGTTTLWFAGAISVFVMWSHRSNILRLLRGEEGSFRGAAPEPGSKGGIETHDEPDTHTELEPHAEIKTDAELDPGPTEEQR